MVVTLALASEMLVLGRITEDMTRARDLARRAIETGQALDTMRAIIRAQGGDERVLDDRGILPAAPYRRAVEADEDGRVIRVEPRTIGNAIVAMGGGRTRMTDEVDPVVGFEIEVKPGEPVSRGQVVATVHGRRAEDLDIGVRAVRSAILIESAASPSPLPLISHRVSESGVEPLQGN